MKRLLTIEFIKLWNSKASRVLVIGYFVLLCLLTLTALIKFDIGPIRFHLAEQGIFNFPYIWHFNTYLASFFKIFLAIIIVSMMSNEYSNRTLKQNLIDGLSKKEFLLSKYLTVVVFSFISTLFVGIITLLLGLIYSDYKTPAIVFSEVHFLFAYFVKLAGFFSFCLFLGVFIKRSAFSLGFLFLWWIIESIIWGVTASSHKSVEYANKFLSYFPLGSTSNLIKEPATRFEAVQALGNQVGETFSTDYYAHWYDYIKVFAYIAIFIWGSYKILSKRDL